MVIAVLPARWLSRHVGDAERARHLNVLVSSVGVLAALAVSGADALPGTCLFQLLAGHPCPFCGMTHAVSAAVLGHLHESWSLHPVGPFVFAVLVVQLPLRAAALARWIDLRWRRVASLERAVAAAIVAGCLAVFVVRWS